MFQFFRERGATAKGEGEGSAPASAAGPAGSRTGVRAMLIDEIGTFLLSHDLELSAINFEFARDIVSGHDIRLIAALHGLLGSGARLTDAAVQELVAKTSPARLTPEVKKAI